MTDAKGLNSTDLIEWLRDPDLLDGSRQHYLDTLAADLQRARAEAETLRQRNRELERANLTFAGQDEKLTRLKAALVKERGCEACWKGQSCGTDCHMNDIALTETP